VAAPRRAFGIVGRVLLGTVLAIFACGSYVWLTTPDVRALVTSQPTTTAFMQLRADEARLAGKTPHQFQKWVSLNRISPTLRRAVLLAEDAGFWEHQGIDYEEIRAAIEANWTRGTPLRGASTITQQLAKNLYLSPSRNPLRKLTELYITRRLEAELSKERILELYLNLIEWGDGIWGAEAAAETYFQTTAANVSPEQAALLAGAIINPRVYSPAHPNARLQRRQQIILARMQK
jgi:monofunctional glycosyltransferase